MCKFQIKDLDSTLIMRVFVQTCRYFEYKQNINFKREEELLRLLDKNRSKNSNYDCVVPSSGGKDSAYVAHELKHKYGMNPLTVTWSPLVYTDIGFKNLVRF